MTNKEKAYQLLKEWKGNSYINGIGVIGEIGNLSSNFGRTALVICNKSHKKTPNQVLKSFKESNISVLKVIEGARPNTPREDVYRLEAVIKEAKTDFTLAIGGGSTIDATKAALVLATKGGNIEDYLGTNLVKNMKASLIIVATTASSGSHLTKYSNITDMKTAQKKLIIDDAIVPVASLFDYRTTLTMPRKVTNDGILDSIAHTFEAYCNNPSTLCEELATTALSLCLEYAPFDLDNINAREAIGLATDLGGYAIMLGGTSGAHLNSFSFVDLTGHGTACGIMNPYYSILFSNAIKTQLINLEKVFKNYGYNKPTLAEDMISFSKKIGAPTTLNELKGFNESYIKKALKAAKDPTLSMKLKNMPIPMEIDDIDIYMKPVLEAAATGNLSLIKKM